MESESTFHNKLFSNVNSFIYIHKIPYYSPGDAKLSKNRLLLSWWRKQRLSHNLIHDCNYETYYREEICGILRSQNKKT